MIFTTLPFANGASGIDTFLRGINCLAWLACLGCLSPAVLRLLLNRGRHLDAIWGIVFLLALNRLSFLMQVSPAFSHATAFILALTVAWASTWYQRHDR